MVPFRIMIVVFSSFQLLFPYRALDYVAEVPLHIPEYGSDSGDADRHAGSTVGH
jgi:hypothetical protein